MAIHIAITSKVLPGKEEEFKAALITSAAMVGLLTWLVMPFLTKLLKDCIRG